jgi:hypothetical protein
MNNRNISCANSRTTNCSGIVNQRGNIFCDSCIELRKASIKNKRDNDIDTLLEKNCFLDQELQNIRSELQLSQTVNSELQNQVTNTTKDLENIKNKYDNSVLINSKFFEQEIDRLNTTLQKFSKDNESLVKSQSKYEIEYNQLKLDLEKMSLDNEKLKSLVDMLTEQNNLFKEENSSFSKLNSELSLELQKMLNILHNPVQ